MFMFMFKIKVCKWKTCTLFTAHTYLVLFSIRKVLVWHSLKGWGSKYEPTMCWKFINEKLMHEIIRTQMFIYILHVLLLFFVINAEKIEFIRPKHVPWWDLIWALSILDIENMIPSIGKCKIHEIKTISRVSLNGFNG